MTPHAACCRGSFTPSEWKPPPLRGRGRSFVTAASPLKGVMWGMLRMFKPYYTLGRLFLPLLNPEWVAA